MSAKPSQAELLETKIKLALTNGYDFSLKSNRANFLSKFVKENETRKWTADSVRPTYNKLLDKIVGKEKTNRSSKKPKFNRSIASQISKKPSGIKDDETGETKPGETGEKPKIEGKKIIIGPDGRQIEVVDQKYENFDAEGVGATIQALFMSLKLVYPDLEALSKDEKESLGNMWLPFFQRYLSENMAYIIVPLMATMGMVLPKVGKARRIKAEKKEKELETPGQEKATQEETERVNKLTCPFCNDLYSASDMPVHKRVCPKRATLPSGK